MPAWEVKKTWSSDVIKEYRKYVVSEGPKRVGSLRSTCEDLALRLVTDFAEQEGLPVAFSSDTYSSGLTPEGYSSKSDYLSEVLTRTAASDLITYRTAVLKRGAADSDASKSLPLAEKGDLIILYSGGGHVQVITSTSPNEIKIVQGNFRSDRCGFSLLWNDQNRPGDPCYIGEIVAEQKYTKDTSGQWSYSGSNPNVFSIHGRLSIWDFHAWNNLVTEYTVKAGDTLSAIALNVYGDGNKWERIYDANRSTIGSDPNRVVAGQKLYLWK